MHQFFYEFIITIRVWNLKSELVWISNTQKLFSFKKVPISDTYLLRMCPKTKQTQGKISDVGISDAHLVRMYESFWKSSTRHLHTVNFTHCVLLVSAPTTWATTSTLWRLNQATHWPEPNNNPNDGTYKRKRAQTGSTCWPPEVTSSTWNILKLEIDWHVSLWLVPILKNLLPTGVDF